MIIPSLSISHDLFCALESTNFADSASDRKNILNKSQPGCEENHKERDILFTGQMFAPSFPRSLDQRER
jgi:hypothetical protein